MTYATKTPAFRFIALALVGTLTAAAIPASAMDRDPTAQVPNWISESSFNSMSASDIYDVGQAQKLGDGVIIGTYTVAESRDLVDRALKLDTVAPQLTSFEQNSFGSWNQHLQPRDR